MKTVHEVSKITGVSIRTLHYYDEIGLLIPAVTTDAGYRLYDDTDLERLQQIMLFRELEFPLKNIKAIVNGGNFDRSKALTQQIELLTLKKERIDRLISMAKQLQKSGEKEMSFQAFDKKKIEDYKAEAKRTWGETEAYREFEKKTASYSDNRQEQAAAGLMRQFEEFGALRKKAPGDREVQDRVKKLQEYITENYYTCTKTILAGLGQMYAAGGEMTDNIDAAGGKGTAEFAAAAIAVFCKE